MGTHTDQLNEIIDELRRFIATELERPASEAGLAYVNSETWDHGYDREFICRDDADRARVITSLWADLRDIDPLPADHIGDYIGDDTLSAVANQAVDEYLASHVHAFPVLSR